LNNVRRKLQEQLELAQEAAERSFCLAQEAAEQSARLFQEAAEQSALSAQEQRRRQEAISRQIRLQAQLDSLTLKGRKMFARELASIEDQERFDREQETGVQAPDAVGDPAASTVAVAR
jgi:hypothetical protein